MKTAALFLCALSIAFGEPLLKKLFFIGETYEFAETDLLDRIYSRIEDNKEEIEARLNQYRAKAKERVENYEPKAPVFLPRAAKDRVFEPDMTYIVPDDIKGADKRIIYPKGYKFNPLDYNVMPAQVVVIDYSDHIQAKWLKESGYLGKLNYQIWTTSGKYNEIAKDLNQSVFYIDPILADRFKLEKTPSLISQMGNRDSDQGDMY